MTRVLPFLDETAPAAGATFSESGLYRYTLWRTWDRARPRVAWLMLNPSTADEFVLDPTLTRCRDFSERWGFGGMDVVNLFAWRSTKPEKLLEVGDPVGAGNDAAIDAIVAGAGLVVAAWGGFPRSSYVARRSELVSRRPELVVDRLNARTPEARRLTPVQCLGYTDVTLDPRHPLYLAKTTLLEPFVYGKRP